MAIIHLERGEVDLAMQILAPLFEAMRTAPKLKPRATLQAAFARALHLAGRPEESDVIYRESLGADVLGVRETHRVRAQQAAALRDLERDEEARDLVARIPDTSDPELPAIKLLAVAGPGDRRSATAFARAPDALGTSPASRSSDVRLLVALLDRLDTGDAKVKS